jgi:hypothetical protein
MKKIILLLCIVVSALSISAQETTYFNCYKTKIVRKYNWQLEWETIRVNTDVSIPLSLTGNTLQISAELATTFVIDFTSLQEVDDDRIKVLSYDAYEITKGKDCKVDFVRMKKTDVSIIGITYLNQSVKSGLHYFIENY